MSFFGTGNGDKNFLAKDIASNGLKASIESLVQRSNDRTSNLIFNELSLRHASWTGLINTKKVETAVVIETGLGASVIALSKVVKNVYALYIDINTKVIVENMTKNKNVTHLLFDDIKNITNIDWGSALAVAYNDLNESSIKRHFTNLVNENKIGYYYYTGYCSLYNTLPKLKKFNENKKETYHIEGSIRDPYKMISKIKKIQSFGVLKYGIYNIYMRLKNESISITNLDINDSLFNSICGDIFDDQNYIIEHIFFIKPSGALLAMHISGKKYMLRITSDSLGKKRLQINNNALKSLKEKNIQFTPSIYKEINYDEYLCSVEECVNGSNISPEELINKEKLNSLYVQATEILIHMHKETVSENQITDDTFKEQISDPISDAKSLFSDAYSSIFDKIELYLKTLYLNKTVPFVFKHGDYSADNIMVANGKITGVIDWEYASGSGLPLMDLIFLICNIHKKNTNINIIDAMHEVILDENLTAIEDECIEKYCASLNIDKSLIFSFGVMNIINFIAYRLEINIDISRKTFFDESFGDILNAINNRM